MHLTHSVVMIYAHDLLILVHSSKGCPEATVHSSGAAPAYWSQPGVSKCVEQYPTTETPSMQALHSGVSSCSQHLSAHAPRACFSSSAFAALYAGVAKSSSFAVFKELFSAARFESRLSMLSVMKSHPPLILRRYFSTVVFSADTF